MANGAINPLKQWMHTQTVITLKGMLNVKDLKQPCDDDKGSSWTSHRPVPPVVIDAGGLYSFKDGGFSLLVFLNSWSCPITAKTQQ